MPTNLTLAKFYKPLKNNVVQCRLCHHFCALKENAIGRCNTRQNLAGKLYSLVYGKPIALQIDPIAKKPLFHFLPASQTFSLGTLGCNFRCLNCQNFDLSQAFDIQAQTKNIPYLSPRQIVASALKANCPSLAYTYNEPTVFGEYALDIMKLAHQHGLKNVWVSNGFFSDDFFQSAKKYIDAANIDLKSMTDKFYREVASARLQPVLDNLKKIKQANIHLEITTLIIPTLSDKKTMLTALARFISQELGPATPWHISRFSPAISWRLSNLKPTNLTTMLSAYKIGRQAGLQYVYLGNVPGNEKENTYCPQCHALAVKRIGFNIQRFDKNGQCAVCHTNLNII